VSGSWPELVPIADPPLPEFDSELLPEVLRAHIDSVSEAKQVPPELVFAFVLGVLAAAVQAKIRVRLLGHYSEPLGVFLVVELDPGERKSATAATVTRPIRLFETELAELVKPKRRKLQNRADLLERRIAHLKRDIGRKGLTPEAEAEVLALQAELDSIEVPAMPTVLMEDVTPEAAVLTAAENRGRAAVLSAEGGFLQILAGRYSDGQANLEFWKKAWTGGEPVTVHRVGRPPVRVPNPSGTIVLAVQRSVLGNLANRDRFRGEGLFGRFLYFHPASRIGSRATGLDAPSLDEKAARNFDTMLGRLLRLHPAATDERTGEWLPHELELEPDALAQWSRFEAEVEGLLAPFSKLESMRDWGAKLAGNTVRVAALLHLAAVADKPDPWSIPVTSVQMERATTLAHRYLVPHAVAAYGAMGRDPDRDIALYLLELMGRLMERDNEVTDSRLLELADARPGIDTKADIEPALRLLEERGYIRRGEVKTGGRPKKVIHLHPLALQLDRLAR
jgi:hypothetical protein